MTTPAAPLDLSEVATFISARAAEDDDYLLEIEPYIVGSEDEQGFLECCAQELKRGRMSRERVGHWLYQRLNRMFGENLDTQSLPFASTITAWAGVLGESKWALYAWVKAAANRELAPRLADYSLTLQAEIARGAPAEPDQRAEAINQALDRIESEGDPQAGIQVLRRERAAQKAGIERFHLSTEKLGDGSVIIRGQTYEGQLEEIIEFKLMPTLDDAVGYYQTWCLKRLGLEPDQYIATRETKHIGQEETARPTAG